MYLNRNPDQKLSGHPQTTHYPLILSLSAHTATERTFAITASDCPSLVCVCAFDRMCLNVSVCVCLCSALV